MYEVVTAAETARLTESGVPCPVIGNKRPHAVNTVKQILDRLIITEIF
jgi:hypothetical protein